MIILAGQSLGAKRARHYLVLQAVRLIQWLTEIRAETAANPCFFRLKVDPRRTPHNGHNAVATLTADSGKVSEVFAGF